VVAISGKVDSFGIDVSNLTSGILNAEVHLKCKNALCLGLELLIEFCPSMLHSRYTTTITLLKDITDKFVVAITSLKRLQLTKANNAGTNLLNNFKALYPGFAKV
jgi:hypothetical protein